MTTHLELEHEVTKLCAENARLAARVEELERGEINRASCCWDNERRADAAEIQVAWLRSALSRVADLSTSEAVIAICAEALEEGQ